MATNFGAAGNVSREDYEAFIYKQIAPAIAAFKVADHQALVGLLTYTYQINLGQQSFRLPRIKSSTGVMDKLGEYGRATYAKPSLEELEFKVDRRGTSLMLTEDAIRAAIESLVNVDAITNTVNDALRTVDRTYASELMTVAMTGWADGTTDAPPYAGRTFPSHSHVVTNTTNGLTYDKIAAAKLLVAEHGYVPDTLLLSPDGENDLVLLLASRNQFGPQLLPPIVEGSVGRFYGLNVFVSPWVTDKKFVVVDAKEKPIVFGQREAPELRSQYDPIERIWDGQVISSFVFGMVKEFAGAVTTYKT